MKHLVMFSGGATSYYTGKLVVEKYGKENCRFVFTDTLIEDLTLYRFILQAVEFIFSVPMKPLLRFCESIPDIEVDEQGRKRLLKELARRVSFTTEKLVWLQDGRTPWDLFRDVRFIGNSRIAPCSHKLKQQVARRWLEDKYGPSGVRVYLGIHWSERDRFYGTATRQGAKAHWEPWIAESPLCDRFDVSPGMIMSQIKKDGLDSPVLYQLGFEHNNCGGFCVRAGQKQFRQLQTLLPLRYAYHEDRERELQGELGTAATILTRTKNGVKQKLSLEELRESQIDADSFSSGCGCFIDPPLEV